MQKRFVYYGLLLMVMLLLSVPASMAQDSTEATESQTDTQLFENVLRVTEVIPQANTAGISPQTSITVVFNRPVVPLTILEERDDLPDPLIFEPELAGEGEWINTSIYIFRPDVAMAGGTTYTVQVADLESTDGAELEPFEWSFSTELPAATAVFPEPLASDVELDDPVSITFNQPMDEASVEAALTVTADDGSSASAIEGTFEWFEGSRRMVFRPSEQLALDTLYRATLDGTQVRAAAGGAGLAGDVPDWSFLTVPPPSIVAINPQDGDAEVNIYDGLNIQFASPMNPETVQDRIRISPEPLSGLSNGFYNDFSDSYRVNFEAAASTTYTVTIDPGMEDVYGNRIDAGRTITYDTAAYRPEVTLQIPGEIGFYNAFYEQTRLYIAHRNVDSIDLSLYDISTADLVDVLTDDDFNIAVGYTPPDNSLIRDWSLDASQIPENQRRFDLLELGEAPIPGGTASCEGALPSRIAVGDVAVVSVEPDPLRARQSPPDGEIVELIYAGYRFNVLDGPRCIDDIPWFQIELRDGSPVWVAESVGDEYFVEPRVTAEQAPVTVTEDGALDPGVYFLTASTQTPNTSYRSIPAHFMMVSTVNVTMKYTPTGAVAWVTNVDTGEPVANVPVQFFGSLSRVVSSAVTDANGIAQIELSRDRDVREQMVAVVDTSDQFGMGATDWTGGINVYQFDVSFRVEPDRHSAYLYTDRPIYRPGQPVFFRGVVRAKEDVSYMQPDFDTVFVRGFDDQNNIIYEETLRLDEFGTFDGEIMLADDAVLGSFYRIQVKEDVDSNNTFTTLYYSVAEFRVPEFQVDVTPQQDEVARGETLNVLVAGDYFFGGGVSDANVNYSVQSEPYTFRYEGEGSFSFRNIEPYSSFGFFPYGEQVGSGDAETDAAGTALLDIATDNPSIEGSQTYTIEATVSDESGFRVSGRSTAIVHQGQLYVGVGTESYVSRVGESNTINVVTVDWDSVPVASQNVDITVEKWNWNTVQEQDDSGRVVFRSEVEQIEVETASVRTGNDGLATYPFTPSEGGVYRIVTTTTDDFGNQITAARVIWASGRQYVPWRQQDERTIDLVADADEYDVGDTANVLITSPFQGEAHALITVEREGVISTDSVLMDSNSFVYELPITDDFAPNVFVSVMLVKGVDENNPVAAFRYGLTQLNVDTERKVVNIDVIPNVDRAQPRDTVSYTIRTTDYKGDPVSAQVGLGLTDLAALSIVGPNSGLLLDRFYGEQALSVRTSTPLTINTDEVTQFIEEVFKGGGGGGGGGGAVFEIRGDFVDTPYWNPDLVTDSNGEAIIDVTLPDNLTTWRMDARAVALADDETFLVGQETTDLLSTRPLLVRPATPRFFVVDDESVLAAVVNNNTGQAQEVTAFVEATGVTFDGDTPVEQVITIPDGGRARFEWPVTVDAVENVDVTFFASAADGEFTDASKSPVGVGDDRLLPVYRFDVPETVGTAGLLRDGERLTESIALPQDYELGGGTLTVNVETSLASTTLDGLDYLRNFPHQCTEQTVSRFLPNIITYSALDALDLADPALEAALDREVNAGLQLLYMRQNVDGGWGWFTRDESNTLITAYVVMGLHEAQEAGYPVERGVLVRGQQYLLDNPVVRNPSRLGGSDWQYNREAFVLYALAKSGAPDVARMSNLYEGRARLDLDGQAFLAMALFTVDETDTRSATLMANISSAARVSASGTFWSANDRLNWSTDTRTTAAILEAMVMMNPESDLIPNVVRYLVSARTADRWETTQETAWSVMALTDWMVVSGELEPDYDFTVTLNDETLITDEAAPATVSETRQLEIDVLDMIQGEVNDLVLERSDGDGNMYYTAFLEAYLPVPEVDAINSGISVARRYLNEDGEMVTSAEVGEVIEVRLTVVVPADLHYVIVEDPIPAGTEPIDPNLDISAQIGTRPELNSLDANRFGWGWWWFSNIEYRDEMVALYSTYLPAGSYEYVYSIRASVPGTYNVIPPTAQEFYFPDVYGRGDGSTFTVVPAE